MKGKKGHIISGTSICVDYWAWAPDKNYFRFLSHLHPDHTINLKSTFREKIHTSPFNCWLLRKWFNISPDLLVPLSIGDTHVIQNTNTRFSVTLLNADHCPGSVMFLFQGTFGNILYTGDFRYDPKMLEHPMLKSLIENKAVDRLYLDNTFAAEHCQFPSREEVLKDVVKVIKGHPDHTVVVGVKSLGKEEVLKAIALQLKEKVCVSEKKLRVLKKLAYPNVFTTDPEDSRIIAKNISQLTPHFIDNLLEERGPVVTIVLTASLPADIDGTIYILPYSDHSCHSELLEFVSKIKPRKIFPIICYQGEDDNQSRNSVGDTELGFGLQEIDSDSERGLATQVEQPTEEFFPMSDDDLTQLNFAEPSDDNSEKYLRDAPKNSRPTQSKNSTHRRYKRYQHSESQSPDSDLDIKLSILNNIFHRNESKFKESITPRKRKRDTDYLSSKIDIKLSVLNSIFHHNKPTVKETTLSNSTVYDLEYDHITLDMPERVNRTNDKICKSCHSLSNKQKVSTKFQHLLVKKIPHKPLISSDICSPVPKAKRKVACIEESPSIKNRGVLQEESNNFRNYKTGDKNENEQYKTTENICVQNKLKKGKREIDLSLWKQKEFTISEVWEMWGRLPNFSYEHWKRAVCIGKSSSIKNQEENNSRNYKSGNKNESDQSKITENTCVQNKIKKRKREIDLRLWKPQKELTRSEVLEMWESLQNFSYEKWKRAVRKKSQKSSKKSQ